MTDIDRLIEDLEHQLDVLESALATGQPVAAPEPFVAPVTTTPLTAGARARASALQRRLVAAQELVATDLERTRQELALTEGDAGRGEAAVPRFLDTTF